jgi:glycosyltransferase involved in cell wall biosynthesis
VSVVVPLHDVAATVEEAIASVAAQTMPDWELVLVDDASADASLPIALEATAGLSQPVRSLASPGDEPTGPSAARNRGLAVATADRVAFLDADDRWEPEFLARRLATLDADPELAMAWGPARYWYPDRPDLEPFVQPTGQGPRPRRLAAGEPLAGWVGQLRTTPCPSATVLCRSVVDAVGGFDERLRRAEDVALWIAVATDHPTAFDPEVLTHYRRHDASSTSRATGDGTLASAELAFGRWLLRWAAARPDLAPLLPAAARVLHGYAHDAAAGANPVVARWRVTKLVLGERPARRRWWAVGLDWLLPLPASRRVAARLDRVGVDPQRGEAEQERDQRQPGGGVGDL